MGQPKIASIDEAAYRNAGRLAFPGTGTERSFGCCSSPQCLNAECPTEFFIWRTSGFGHSAGQEEGKLTGWIQAKIVRNLNDGSWRYVFGPRAGLTDLNKADFGISKRAENGNLFINFSGSPQDRIENNFHLLRGWF